VGEEFLTVLVGFVLVSLFKLPLMEIKSSNSGPVVWLTGCVHGDELGESYVVNERNVEYGVRSISNILAYLGMIRPKDEFFFTLRQKVSEEKFLITQINHPVLLAALSDFWLSQERS